MKVKKYPSQQRTTLVRVSNGTAELLRNLRNKYSENGDKSIDNVIRGMWRDVCEFKRNEIKKNYEQVQNEIKSNTQ